MKKMYVTITGLKHYFGSEFLETGMQVKLVKDVDNEVDSEAIRVEIAGLGKIGYIANSPYTVLGESMSAGRIYDKFDDEAIAKVKYVLSTGVLCEVEERKENEETRIEE